MELSRARQKPLWMKDYCESPKSKKRSIEKVELPKKIEKKSKIELNRLDITELGKKICYTPLAFLPKKTETSWKRSVRAYKRLESKKELTAYRRSKIYKTTKKTKELVEKRKTDDFLTKRFSVTSCGEKGLGLRAVEPIEKGDVITFYGGKIVDVSQRPPINFEHNHYLFGLPQEGFCIDGEFYCSHASLVNHGKKPNAFAFLYEEDDKPSQIAYIAKERIDPGDDIEINYDDGRDSPLFFKATGEKFS